MRSQPEYKNRYLQPEYMDNVPLPEPYQPEEILLPIFTKDRLPRSGIEVAKPAPKWCIEGFKSFSETPIALKEVDTTDLEISVSRQNLVLVDGWGILYVYLCIILMYSNSMVAGRDHQIISSIYTTVSTE